MINWTTVEPPVFQGGDPSPKSSLNKTTNEIVYGTQIVHTPSTIWSIVAGGTRDTSEDCVLWAQRDVYECLSRCFSSRPALILRVYMRTKGVDVISPPVVLPTNKRLYLRYEYAAGPCAVQQAIARLRLSECIPAVIILAPAFSLNSPRRSTSARRLLYMKIPSHEWCPPSAKRPRNSRGVVAMA